MVQAELNVEVREKAGKGVARKLRAVGKVPAVVYGKDIEPQTITVDPKALEKAVEGDINTLLSLKGVPALDGKVVVLKEVDYHPIKRDMVCVDFHTVSLTEKSSFMVPVHTVGTSAGEKMGGSLQLIRHELEVMCLPTEVPHSIDIDVTALEIGDTLHIEDVKAPAGADLVFDVNFTVITVIGHKAEAPEGDEPEATEE